MKSWTAVTSTFRPPGICRIHSAHCFWKLLEMFFVFFFLFHSESSFLSQALLLAGFGSEGVQLIPLGNTPGLPHDNFNLLLLSYVTPWLLGHNFFISQGHKLYKCLLRKKSIAWVCGRQFFHGLAVGRISGWFKQNYIYCALYFHFYYNSSTSDDQALDPGGWGALF